MVPRTRCHVMNLFCGWEQKRRSCFGLHFCVAFQGARLSSTFFTNVFLFCFHRSICISYPRARFVPECDICCARELLSVVNQGPLRTPLATCHHQCNNSFPTTNLAREPTSVFLSHQSFILRIKMLISRGNWGLSRNFVLDPNRGLN